HVGEVVAADPATHDLVDVRPQTEFDGTVPSTVPTDSSCLAGPPLCTTTYAGRIPSAQHLPLTELLQPGEARVRSLSELDAALASLGLDPDSETLVYDADSGAGAVATFVLLGVVGLPTRWYAGGFAEWGSLNASHPDPALRSLPTDSPWRTDSEAEVATWAGSNEGVRPLVFDPYATSSDAVPKNDRAYLASPPALPGAGDGGSGCSD
ncbi:MAG TPA: rhodanese-like domain-containing protein, partial [Polyangiaceae bacterium]|nr:rhodanese-like domain-containing protein [Polyangiaceae bacterium]